MNSYECCIGFTVDYFFFKLVLPCLKVETVSETLRYVVCSGKGEGPKKYHSLIRTPCHTC